MTICPARSRRNRYVRGQKDDDKSADAAKGKDDKDAKKDDKDEQRRTEQKDR